jgi:iron complex outermembrane recepter protein
MQQLKKYPQRMRDMNLTRSPLALAIAIAATPIFNQAHASDTDSFAIEEIVVTAQKREQSLQDVPIAVTALSGDFLQQTGSVNLSDVANVTPGLNISNTQSEGGGGITMRGIGSNDFGYSSDSSIPVYLDGVYMGGGANIVGDLMDVAQIEVLKGPQGTLFGRNAVGGAVSVTTTRPGNDVEAQVKIGGGNYGLRTVKGMANLPLIEDKLYLRVSGSTRNRDGWQENVSSGERDGYEQDRWNGRAKLLWTPTDNLEIELTSDWQREQDHAGYFNVLGGAAVDGLNSLGFLSSATLDAKGKTASAGNAFFDGASIVGPDGSGVDHKLDRKVRGNALKVSWDINEDLTLTSITSYRELKSAISEDNDGTEYLVLNIRSFMDNEEYSQEFRLNGSSDKLDWFVGLSAYRADVDGQVNDSFGAIFTGAPFDETAIVHGQTESYALFGDAIYALNDTTNITFGLRASYDTKSQEIKNPQAFGLLFASPNQLLGADGNPDPSLAKSRENWDDISPRLVVDHQINEDVMVFAGVSQGFKSGGFNSFPTVDPGTGFVPFGSTDPFDEEKITNYEAGFKSTLMEGRLRLNGSAYYYDFEDLQFLVTNGSTVSAQNAGSATGKGIDLETMFLITENLSISANLGWLDSEYGDDVIDSDGSVIVSDGQDLANAPSFSGNVGVDYLLPLGDMGELRTHLNYAYTGDQTHNGSDTAEIYKEDGYGLLSARISWMSSDEQWEVAAWGTNLTNEDTIESFGGVTDDFGFVSVRRGEPRMYGVELSYTY